MPALLPASISLAIKPSSLTDHEPQLVDNVLGVTQAGSEVLPLPAKLTWGTFKTAAARQARGLLIEQLMP